jgi:ATP-dependent helicase/nuclease subunit A
MAMTKQELIIKASTRQNSAAKIDHSVWVSASAGTGKTHVLTKRILRLLMEDHFLKPAQILAVTFTRAAAREMAVRIRESVAEWQKMDDETLMPFLKNYLARPVTEADKIRARSLFVTILDEPVNTNTIHGLCQQILGKFPV